MHMMDADRIRSQAYTKPDMADHSDALMVDSAEAIRKAFKMTVQSDPIMWR
jgi:hypothetical protein